jgi:hypothetical protein
MSRNQMATVAIMLAFTATGVAQARPINYRQDHFRVGYAGSVYSSAPRELWQWNVVGQGVRGYGCSRTRTMACIPRTSADSANDDAHQRLKEVSHVEGSKHDSGDHRFELWRSGYNNGLCACWSLRRPNRTIATGGAEWSPAGSGLHPIDVLR